MRKLKLAAYVGFIAQSISISMLIGQESAVKPNSVLYFAIVLPTLFLPLLWWRGIITAAFRIGRPLVAFGVLAGAWQLAMGDYRAAIQLFLFVWVLLWICALDVRLTTTSYLKLFGVAVFVGCAGYAILNNNPWGILPRTTSVEYLVWRVSFFPSLVLTGFFALFALIVVSESRARFGVRLASNMLGFYFLIFCFVRTAMLVGVVYAPLALAFSSTRQNWRVMFFVPLGLALLIHGAILMAPYVLVHLQGVEIVSRLLLRGSTGLQVQDLYEQLSRPWIWQKHIEFFLNSPYMMGLGNFDFFSLAIPNSGPKQAQLTGSEALLTRLFATYGLPTLFLLWFLGKQLYRHARAHDYLGCAIFPGVIIMAMNYGSVLHPSNFLFLLYFQLLIHGRNSFADTAPRELTALLASNPPILGSKSV